MPPYGPSDAQKTEAYWLWRDGWSLQEIATHMGVRSKSTAQTWVNLGRELESENGGPLAKRRAQRERVAHALNSLRVKIEQDMTAGRLERAPGYRLQMDLLARYAQLLGLPAAPEPRKTKVDVTSDGKVIGVDPDLQRALAALASDETLPNREEEP